MATVDGEQGVKSGWPRRPSEADDTAAPEAVLVTGFPAFTARRFIARVLASEPSAHVFILARDQFVDDARAFAAGRPASEAARIEVIEGDVCSMDLGLAGGEFKTLASEITTIHHMAGIYYLGVDKATARRVNVECSSWRARRSSCAACATGRRRRCRASARA
jgi:hypothetical protein